MFYTFTQNNSGGSFDYDEDAGISHHVIVEADNENEAVWLAKKIGLYFDGVSDGMDCACCGDRWSDYMTSYDTAEEPTIHGNVVKAGDKWQKNGQVFGFKWMKDRPEGFIHYKDGRIESFWE